jgi:hypothetical protein
MLSLKGDPRAQTPRLPMCKYYFHIASDCRVYADDRGVMLSYLADAYGYAISLIWHCMRYYPEEGDWRGWRVQIADHTGRTLVVVPFTTVPSEAFGRRHTSKAPL